MMTPMSHSSLLSREIKRMVCISGRLLYVPTVNQSWFKKSVRLNESQREQVNIMLKERGISVSSKELNTMTEKHALKLIKK